MSKWKVTIQRSKTQRKQITVSGPATAKLAEATALEAMDWDAKDCESVEAEPADDNEPDAPTTIDMAMPEPRSTKSATTSITPAGRIPMIAAPQEMGGTLRKKSATTKKVSRKR